MAKKTHPTSSSDGVTLLDQTESDPSYEAVYSGSVWTGWLREHAAHALRFRPVPRAKPHGVRGARAPHCPACTKVMLMSMPDGVWICRRENPGNVKIRCDVRLPAVMTEGPIIVYDEDGKRRVPRADLQNRAIDIVFERGKYRARGR